MKPRTIVAAALAAVLAVAVALAAALGLVTVESHRGFFAPAWSADAGSVYFLERRTRGVTWGFGWESFTPPAHARVQEDRVELRVLDVASGEVRTLATMAGSPLEGRIVANYRGRIFSHLSSAIDASREPLRFAARLSIPRVPRSEVWQISGTWPPEGAPPVWTRDGGGGPRTSEPVLATGVELMLAPGEEAFPSAILGVDADGGHRVLLSNARFDALHPGGVPSPWLAERSRREDILRARDFRDTHATLVARFRAEGMSEGAASLAAYDRMKETAHLPPDPTVTATRVDAAPEGEPVFTIPSGYFAAGLFRDVGAAIASPGTAVETGTGDYLRYHEDDVGVRLRRHRERNDVFHVRSDGVLYRLEVERPPRALQPAAGRTGSPRPPPSPSPGARAPAGESRY